MTESASRRLAPTGRLRAVINAGNPVLAPLDPATGQPGGVSVALARELGRRLGLEVQLVTVDTAAKSFATLQSGAVDVGFLAIDPLRAAELDFTAPYVTIEGCYLVRTESPLRSVAEVDRPGIRIASSKNSAYDLYLARTLKHATLAHAGTSEEALELFKAQRLEAAAGVRQALDTFIAAEPGHRVIEPRFMAIEQAMTLPKGRDEAALRYLRAFVEEMKASGFVADALRRSGHGDVTVSPPA